MTTLCDNFKNQPVGGYKPLSCKQPVVTTRDIKNTGLANHLEFFFLTKPNTIREHATIDLLYPHPTWLKQALQKSIIFSRVTVGGFRRVTTDGFLRVVKQA